MGTYCFRRILGGLLAVAAALSAAAAAPPPEQLLPNDALVVLAIPDAARLKVALSNEPAAQLWRDPAMKPFRDKLETRVHQELVAPVEKQLGFTLADASRLAQGQVVLALLRNGWDAGNGRQPGWLLLLDARDQATELARRLTNAVRQATAAGWRTTTSKAGDVELTTLAVPRAAVSVAPDQDSNDTNQPPLAAVPVTFCQAGSLLVVGSGADVVAGVLARQGAASAGGLKENVEFARDHGAGLHTAGAYVWVHARPLIEILQSAAKAREQSAGGALMGLQPSKLIGATGLGGLKTLALSFQSAADGGTAEIRLGLPAAERAGLFRLLVPEPKEAGPGPFVPADVVRFQRLRLDLPGAWGTLETMVFTAFPAARSVMDLMLGSVGKDKDPNYDWRAELIGNLGDDVTVCEFRPATNTLAALGSPPSLFLVGAKAPERVIGALKATGALLPAPLNQFEEHEVAGTKVQTMGLPPGAGTGDSAPTPRRLSLVGTNGYLALTAEDALLEAYLRSAGKATNALRDLPGLAAAAAKVGGYNGGWFIYENSRESARVTIEALRHDAGSLEELLAAVPIGPEGGELKEWLDFSLLPPFDAVARYFHFTVYGTTVEPDAVRYRMFAPTPPGLK